MYNDEDWEFIENKAKAQYKSESYEIVIELERDRLGYEHLTVSCDDDKANYTHGSYTNASIPISVIEELLSRRHFL